MAGLEENIIISLCKFVKLTINCNNILNRTYPNLFLKVRLKPQLYNFHAETFGSKRLVCLTGLSQKSEDSYIPLTLYRESPYI